MHCRCCVPVCFGQHFHILDGTHTVHWCPCQVPLLWEKTAEEVKTDSHCNCPCSHFPSQYRTSSDSGAFWLLHSSIPSTGMLPKKHGCTVLLHLTSSHCACWFGNGDVNLSVQRTQKSMYIARSKCNESVLWCVYFLAVYCYQVQNFSPFDKILCMFTNDNG